MYQYHSSSKGVCTQSTEDTDKSITTVSIIVYHLSYSYVEDHHTNVGSKYRLQVSESKDNQTPMTLTGDALVDHVHPTGNFQPCLIKFPNLFFCCTRHRKN